MTIRDIAETFAKLEKSSVSKWDKQIRLVAKTQKEMLHEDLPFFMSITLPDGQWWAKVYQYRNARDGWCYTIPETREQEKRMLGI